MKFMLIITIIVTAVSLGFMISLILLPLILIFGTGFIAFWGSKISKETKESTTAMTPEERDKRKQELISEINNIK